MSIPESSRAWIAAATIICAKRSIRRAFFFSMKSTASKPFSSQAKWTGYSLASNCAISAAPDLPAARFSHVVSTSFPKGLTAPRPVITTRLRPFIDIYIPNPPSTRSTSPVTNEAASEQRNRTAPATSSGSPKRPSGVLASIAFWSSSGSSVVNRVEM